jgi:nucleolar complex protein 2
LITEKTGQFIPITQYILYPFDIQNDYLNAKSKTLVDKQIPETLVALKIAKKHADTIEMKDRIVKEIVDELTIYLAHNSRSLSFPELVIPIGVLLRKFKKNT